MRAKLMAGHFSIETYREEQWAACLIDEDSDQVLINGYGKNEAAALHDVQRQLHALIKEIDSL